MKARVVVGLSGGVDSSVAAWLLHEQGYEVVGVTFWLYDDRGSFRKTCCGVEAIQAARRLAHRLGIPHYVIDERPAFRRHIIHRFIQAYRGGQTPNVCLLCNRWFKFRKLLDFARDIGARWIATGHFARVQDGALYEGVDKAKDQSYFLAAVEPEVLASTLFPVGTLTKEEVRAIARRASLPTAGRVESQEICFAEGDTRSFLMRHIPPRPGDIVDLSGRVVGRHPGAWLFTLGQRRGLRVALGYRAYVVDVDVENNRIVVGPREAVGVQAIRVRPLQGDVRDGEHYRVKVRSSHRGVRGRLTIEGGWWRILFEERVWPPAPGQMAVVYEGEKVVGAGVVVQTLREGGEPWRKPCTAQGSSRVTVSTSST